VRRNREKLQSLQERHCSVREAELELVRKENFKILERFEMTRDRRAEDWIGLAVHCRVGGKIPVFEIV
jgi:hypothetical protein